MHGHRHAGPPPPIEGLDPLSTEVLGALRRMMHLNRQFLSRMLTQAGGHPGQHGSLRVIAENEGMSQSDLASRMHLARPTVTAMLQRLEADGLIERWTDEHDQRVTRLRVTGAGRDAVEATRDSFRAYADATLSRLEEKDRLELVRLLGLVSDGLADALGLPDGLPSAGACAPGPSETEPTRNRP